MNYYRAADLEDNSCLYTGCTDSTRANYNPSATVDSGTCTAQHPGCTNPAALNYVPLYNADDGSCIIPGCTDPSSAQYTADATFGYPGACTSRRLLQAAGTGCCTILDAANFDSSCAAFCGGAPGDFSCCDFTIRGCTDSLASNYFLAASEESGDCEYAVLGCTIASSTLNFDSAATQLHACTFEQLGCTDSHSSDYVNGANTDDSTCTYPIVGCSDVAALNFDSRATVSAACAYPTAGCMDSAAFNFAADATSPAPCRFSRPGCMLPAAVNFDSRSTRDDGSCVWLSPPPTPPPPLQPTSLQPSSPPPAAAGLPKSPSPSPSPTALLASPTPPAQIPLRPPPGAPLAREGDVSSVALIIGIMVGLGSAGLLLGLVLYARNTSDASDPRLKGASLQAMRNRESFFSRIPGQSLLGRMASFTGFSPRSGLILREYTANAPEHGRNPLVQHGDFSTSSAII